MKILQLVTKRQYRGAEVFAANLSEELIKLGHEIMFVGLYENNKDILEVKGAENIDLIENESVFSIQLVKKIICLVREKKPDVIQCNGSDTLKYMVSASYFVPKVPILYRNISMISQWVNNGPHKFLYKNMFKKIDHVSSVGEEALADFIRTFNYPSNQTSVIRRGIPMKQLDAEEARRNLKKELDLGEEDQIAMHIGNFSVEKNHIFLIDVFSNLKTNFPHIKLVCVGAGILWEEIKAEVRNRGLEKTIYFLGFRKDIPEVLAGSDFFVLSSKVEGVPGVILEAATQGKPAIATDVGGVREVLVNNETGFVVQDFNKDEFQNKIVSLATDVGLRTVMGKKAYKQTIEHFNPLENAKKFEELYLEMIGKNKSLKILQLIQKKQYRGAEIFACQLSNHLLDMNHQVEVYSVYEGSSQLPFKGVVKSLDRRPHVRYYDFKGWKDLAKIIKQYKPDIIQANAADTLKYAIFSKFLFSWNVPIVFRNASTSSFYIKNEFSKKLNAFLLKRTDYILSVSKASKKDLNTIFPFTEKSSIVIPVGIEERQFLNDQDQIIPFDVHQKNILHIGSFTVEKNHLELIDIFIKVKKQTPSAILHLIGEGPLKSDIINYIKKHGLEESVIIHGDLQDPYPYLKMADVLVLPSLVEGLPAVILEAMYYKTPVVAYDVGGVSEIISPETGILINKDDEIAFAEAVVKALNTKDSIKIETAYKFVKANFMNREIAQQFLKAYKSIL